MITCLASASTWCGNVAEKSTVCRSGRVFMMICRTAKNGSVLEKNGSVLEKKQCLREERQWFRDERQCFREERQWFRLQQPGLRHNAAADAVVQSAVTRVRCPHKCGD